MMPKSFQDMWVVLAPAVGDHLWQSTLVAIIAGWLTLLLRKNHARVRYGIWLAASLKFLIPFSLLVSVGSHLAHLRTIAAQDRLYVVVNAVSQPFSRTAVAICPVSSFSPRPAHGLFLALAAIWICGLTAVLAAWYVRWNKISRTIQQAHPLNGGRELEALRRMERIGGLRHPIRMFCSPAAFEPGVFGMARPVLLWPEGISKHLDDVHLEAIIAHEVWHVRRRDNLAAAVHMGVEAIFWFYPLVWWLGTRLVDERERACDEQVLALGSERRVYAESILRTCKFCAGFPLPCVSGVTGGNLKRRITHIMTPRAAHNLDFRKKLLLAGSAFVAIVLPVSLGLLHASPLHARSLSEIPVPSPQVLDTRQSAVGQPFGRVMLPVANAAPAKKKACSKSKSAHTARLVSSAQSPGREER